MKTNGINHNWTFNGRHGSTAKRLTRRVRQARRLVDAYPIRGVDEISDDDAIMLAADFMAANSGV